MSDLIPAALNIEYSKVIPSRFVTKRNGEPMSCVTCGTTLVMGEAFAAVTNDGKWHSYCARCAASEQAQIAGLVKRIEAVAEAGNVPQAVLQTVGLITPDVEQLLGRGSVDRTLFLRTKATLLQVRTQIGQAQAPAPTHRSNAYGGKCGTCGVWIEPQGGKIEKVGGRWVTYHVGACPAPQAAAPQVDLALGLYIDTSGTVRKVYKTRNERVAVKVLVPQTTGEINADGTPRLRGSFQYVTGGVRILRDLLAKGEAHILTQDEAAAFGRQFSFCVNCGLYLDDDRSLAAGYGPKCASNKGWWYPNYEEASVVLGRPAGPAKTGTPNEPVFTAPVIEDTTSVCEYCDEDITLRDTYSIDASEDFHFTKLWVDSTGSETCSGDDADGPDYHHKPLTEG